MTNKVKSFLRLVRAELKKVTWPTRSEIIKSTIVAVVAIIVFSIIIGGIDVVFLQILRIFLG